MLFLYPCLTIAQQTNVRVQLDSSDYRIGDPIALKLSIDHPYGVEIRWAASTIADSGFTKLHVSPVDSIRQKLFLTENKIITVTAFNTGHMLTPAMTFFFFNPDRTIDSGKTNRVLINVSAAAADISKPYRTIAPPLSVDTAFNFIYLITAAVALILAGCLLFFVKRNRKKRLPKTIAVPVLSPLSAGQELQQLLDRLSSDNMIYSEFYVELSNILRRFIGAHFNYPAPEHTSIEIMRFLLKKINDKDLLINLSAVFELADFVKFAGTNPSKQQTIQSAETSIRFVNQILKDSHEFRQQPE